VASGDTQSFPCCRKSGGEVSGQQLTGKLNGNVTFPAMVVRVDTGASLSLLRSWVNRAFNDFVIRPKGIPVPSFSTKSLLTVNLRLSCANVHHAVDHAGASNNLSSGKLSAAIVKSALRGRFVRLVDWRVCILVAVQ
jgi:hypothetical protein